MTDERYWEVEQIVEEYITGLCLGRESNEIDTLDFGLGVISVYDETVTEIEALVILEALCKRGKLSIVIKGACACRADKNKFYDLAILQDDPNTSDLAHSVFKCKECKREVSHDYAFVFFRIAESYQQYIVQKYK